MMTWTTVSTTHASGEANSAFSSFAAIVKIMISGGVFPAGEIDENILQARLRRLQPVESPVLLDRPPDERLGRVAAPGELHAEEGRLRALGGGDAGQRGELRQQRRPP